MKKQNKKRKKTLGTMIMICLLRPGVTATLVQLSTKPNRPVSIKL